MITGRHLSQSGRLLLFFANRKFLLLSLPSYLSTTGYFCSPCIANLNDRLFHSRPSLPICPLLTCISQSGQSLHSPILQNANSFRSLPNRVVSPYSSITPALPALLTWMTGFFETTPMESLPLDMAGIKAIITQQGTECDNR